MPLGLFAGFVWGGLSIAEAIWWKGFGVIPNYYRDLWIMAGAVLVAAVVLGFADRLSSVFPRLLFGCCILLAPLTFVAAFISLFNGQARNAAPLFVLAFASVAAFWLCGRITAPVRARAAHEGMQQMMGLMEAEVAQANKRLCPSCEEVISATASVCPHCGNEDGLARYCHVKYGEVADFEWITVRVGKPRPETPSEGGEKASEVQWVCLVTIENTGTEPYDYDVMMDFTMSDSSAGENEGYSSDSPRYPPLSEETLEPGDSASGYVVFGLPARSRPLTVAFEPKATTTDETSNWLGVWSRASD